MTGDLYGGPAEVQVAAAIHIIPEIPGVWHGQVLGVRVDQQVRRRGGIDAVARIADRHAGVECGAVGVGKDIQRGETALLSEQSNPEKVYSNQLPSVLAPSVSYVLDTAQQFLDINKYLNYNIYKNADNVSSSD